MELIPVLDLARGVAVHAVGGDRARYAPVRSVLTPGVQGDALALARAYRSLPGVSRCYVADLDAIAGRPAQRDLVARLRSDEGFGGPLLLDAGVASLADRDRLAIDSTDLIVGLETLRSFADLAGLAALGRITFSLDLRNDVALVTEDLKTKTLSTEPEALARGAIGAGARSLILLDVGRVGRGVGLNLELFASLRRALPRVPLLAGGGVRGAGDLDALAGIGCDGVLVASALHRGVIGAAPGTDQSAASAVR
ncbi:MAG: putative histidine biosynthesis protein [Gemmatimonadetes bacterium]|nr:putative histidine biosynthesis protein [Gemmatimonadota bacterium]